MHIISFYLQRSAVKWTDVDKTLCLVVMLALAVLRSTLNAGSYHFTTFCCMGLVSCFQAFSLVEEVCCKSICNHTFPKFSLISSPHSSETVCKELYVVSSKDLRIEWSEFAIIMWNNNDGARQGSSHGRSDGGNRGFHSRRARGFGGNSWRGRGRGKYNMYGKGKLNDHHLEDIVGPTVTDTVDMTPVPSTVHDNAAMSWMMPAPPPPPPEPFKFEPPETDEHLEALAFMRLLKEDRQLMKAWDHESEYFDCSGLHGIGQMCQFCDGRRGPWAGKAKRNEPEAGFLKYQESVINSLQGRQMDPAESDALNPSKLGSLGDDSKFDFADAEFGVNSNSLSILG